MGFVTTNGVSLAYEESGPTEGVPMLLIMGLAAQLTFWPDSMIDGLARAGFRVIRFDNRDIGLSHKFDEAGLPDLAAIAAGGARAPYLLSDMATDTVGLLDALDIGRAHVVGMSMGGAIGQIVAADHPARCRSLTLIMASTHAPDLPPGTPEARAALMAQPEDPSDREQVIRLGMRVRRAIGSPAYPLAEADAYAFYARQIDRNYHPDGIVRQAAATMASGHRRDLVARIGCPTLVLHGEADPVRPIEHGRDLAARIPGAALRTFPGMGHDLPEELVPALVAAITDHAFASDRVILSPAAIPEETR